MGRTPDGGDRGHKWQITAFTAPAAEFGRKMGEVRAGSCRRGGSLSMVTVDHHFEFGSHRPGSAVHRSCHAVPSCPQEPSLVETAGERHIPEGCFTLRSWRFENSMETGGMES